MLDNSMNLTPAEEAAVAAMTSRNIKVPATATTNGTTRRWTEIVVVEGGTFEEGLSNNGASHQIFVLKTKIVPGGADDNVGRWVNDFIRVNFAVIKGNKAAAGTNDPSKEASMSAMSLKKLKQLAVIAGFNLAGGLTVEMLNAMFTSDGSASVLAGRKIALLLSDNSAKQYNGESTQNVENFLKIEV